MERPARRATPRGTVDVDVRAKQTPRSGLAGASGGAGWWSARTNSANLEAASRRSLGRSSAAERPGNHRPTDQGHGNSSVGVPAWTGTGIGKGRRGANTGSQRCSWRTSGAASARRGSRAIHASPMRGTTLSQPWATIRTAWFASCGNCAVTRRPITASSIWISAVGVAIVFSLGGVSRIGWSDPLRSRRWKESEVA